MPFTAEYHHDEPTREEIDHSSGPMVLEFGANWCGHCLALSPTLQRLFNQFPHVQHVRIADARGKRLGRSFRVKLWPTLVFVRDGQVMARLVRPSDEEVQEAFGELLS